MLANKIALVTGSSKGIGAGIALELAKSGEIFVSTIAILQHLPKM
jgi:NAD(P)-dependent dehydrogenase (short-subunit alcohol dehydrogenase family)